MSAPPLPEAFGNYALGDFVEVISPASISWLPQTPGWLFGGRGDRLVCRALGLAAARPLVSQSLSQGGPGPAARLFRHRTNA